MARHLKLALGIAAFVFAVGCLLHDAYAGCMSQASPPSCPPNCTSRCPAIWEGTEGRGVNVPGESLVDQPCRAFDNTVSGPCGTTPAGRESMGCTNGPDGTQCCYKIAGDSGTITLGQVRSVPKDGAYPPCGGQPGD